MAAVPGSGVLTPLQHSALKGTLQEAQNKHGQQLPEDQSADSSTTVHCKGTLQEI
jgi:hypothetical protein